MSSNPETSAAFEKAYADGVMTERARIQLILSHPAAANNLPVTVQCISTGLSADQADAVLDTLPASTTDSFAAQVAAMAIGKASRKKA